MAALNFPSTPTHLDTYTDPNQAVWQYDSDGTYWNVITSTTRKNFSGIKRYLSSSVFFNSSSEAIEWDSTEYEIDNYALGSETRIYIPTTGFYRVYVNLETNTAGEGSSYTFNLKLNNDILETISCGPNQSVNYDQTLELVAGDYLDIFGQETTSTGGITDASEFTVYRIGYAPGTGISNHSAFSGARVILNAALNTTSVESSVGWSDVDFNANANVLGDLYWYNSVDDRLTVRTSGYYKIRSFVQTGEDGSGGSYRVRIRKNGAAGTYIDTVDLSPNDFADFDQVVYLAEDDFIELRVTNTDNVGNIKENSYLELVREGV